jgi:hypothetical protein
LKKLIAIVLLVAALAGCGASCGLEVVYDPETGQSTVRGHCDFPEHQHRE